MYLKSKLQRSCLQFSDPRVQESLDENWEHTQLRVVKCQAVVVYKAPGWGVLVTSLPACEPLHHLELECVSPLYECQQIRSYKSTAVILFTEKKMEQVSNIWTNSSFLVSKSNSGL